VQSASASCFSGGPAEAAVAAPREIDRAESVGWRVDDDDDAEIASACPAERSRRRAVICGRWRSQDLWRFHPRSHYQPAATTFVRH